MPELDVRGQKRMASLEPYRKLLVRCLRRYGWCLPLPFLIGFEVGYGSYILGVAYYSVLVEQPGQKGVALLGAAAGLLWIDAPGLRWKYGTLLLLVTVQQWILEARAPALSRLQKSLLHGILLFITMLLLSFSGLLAEYSLTLLLLETGLLIGFEGIYMQIRNGRARGWPQRDIERIEASLALGSLLAAGAGLHLGKVVLTEAGLAYIAMQRTEREGAAGGLLWTMPAAAFLCLTDTGGEGLLIWMLLLIGATEAFRGRARWQIVLSAAASSLLYLILFMPGGLGAGMLTLALSLAGFLLYPSERIVRDPEGGREKDEEELRLRLRRELERSRAAFSRLGQLVPQRTTMSRRRAEWDRAYHLQMLAGAVCEDCSRREECWSRSFVRIQEAVWQILRSPGEKELEEAELPEEFCKNCIRLPEFIARVRRQQELRRMNQSWENRLGQSRRLVRGQYELMAACLEKLEMRVMTVWQEPEELRRRIERFFAGQGIGVRQLRVWMDTERDRMQISFLHDTPLEHGQELCCRNGLTQLTGRPIEREETHLRRSGGWHSAYRDRNRIEVEGYGICRKAERVSGDSYRLEPLDEYRYMIALGDGMGTGTPAAEESSQALQMLEQLLLTGMDDAQALRMLHASLVLGAREERFTTLDIALIDRHTGVLRLIKAGGAVTYLARRGRVAVCRSTSLPLGLLEEEAAPEIFEYRLEPGDRIVMISDGVLDQLEDPRQGEEWIRRYLTYTKTESAQRMAEEILKGLQEQTTRSRIEDDKTILTARICS